MNFEEVKILLDGCFRWELRDHAFGDTEFGWKNAEGKDVAEGYSGSGTCTIWYSGNDTERIAFSFTGEEARALKLCGPLKEVERNDETGPDRYVEGLTMPGLTLEGVRDELTGRDQ